jgi:hypothetical protein
MFDPAPGSRGGPDRARRGCACRIAAPAAIVSRKLVDVRRDPRSDDGPCHGRPNACISPCAGGAEPARRRAHAPVRAAAPDPPLGQGRRRECRAARRPLQDDRAARAGRPGRRQADGARPALPGADGVRAHGRGPPPGPGVARGHAGVAAQRVPPVPGRTGVRDAARAARPRGVARAPRDRPARTGGRARPRAGRVRPSATGDADRVRVPARGRRRGARLVDAVAADLRSGALTWSHEDLSGLAAGDAG